MKQIITIILCLIFGITAFNQPDSVRGKQFQLKGRIVEKVQLPPHCGTIAWGTVIQFDIIELSEMTYPNKSIGIIITCPEFYKNDFFVKGKTYQIVFSDRNQANFGWVIPNKDLLKKNGLSFDPYAVSVKKISL